MTNRSRSDEPPMVLDGARVLEYAPFDVEVGPRAGSAVAGGVVVDLANVAGVVVVEDLARGHLFLLHANADWETLTAMQCADVGSAKALAERDFPGVARLWREFRDLTAEEKAELETTRNFLRELLAADPDA